MEGGHVQAPPHVTLRRTIQIVDTTLEQYQADGVTYRLETRLTLEEAIRIAESLRPVEP
jgi:hypothetical protein